MKKIILVLAFIGILIMAGCEKYTSNSCFINIPDNYSKYERWTYCEDMCNDVVRIYMKTEYNKIYFSSDENRFVCNCW